MIKLTETGNGTVWVNQAHIVEMRERDYGTFIRLANNHDLMVKEKTQHILNTITNVTDNLQRVMIEQV